MVKPSCPQSHSVKGLSSMLDTGTSHKRPGPLL